MISAPMQIFSADLQKGTTSQSLTNLCILAFVEFFASVEYSDLESVIRHFVTFVALFLFICWPHPPENDKSINREDESHKCEKLRRACFVRDTAVVPETYGYMY